MTESIRHRRVDKMGEEEMASLLRRNVRAYLTCRLMGDPICNDPICNRAGSKGFRVEVSFEQHEDKDTHIRVFPPSSRDPEEVAQIELNSAV